MGNTGNQSTVWRDVSSKQEIDKDRFEKIWSKYSKGTGFMKQNQLASFVKDFSTSLARNVSEDQVMAWIVAMRSDYMSNPTEGKDLLITKAEFIRLFSLITSELSPAKLSDSFKKLSAEAEFSEMIRKSTSKIRIAILSDLACAGDCVDGMHEAVANKAIFNVLRVSSEDIISGVLQRHDFHCFMHPGGNAGLSMTMLGTQGKQNIRDFISAGGGYIGICAGAIAAGCQWPDYLNIAAVSCFALPAHGRVQIDIKNQEFLKMAQLPADQGTKTTSIFVGGPLMTPMNVPNLPEITHPDAVFSRDLIDDVVSQLMKRRKREKKGKEPKGQWTCEQCTFINHNCKRCYICEFCPEESTTESSEFSSNSLPGSVKFLLTKKGEMPGKWAVCRTTYGSGRVLLMAPHPELDDKEFIITNGVYWAVEELRKRGSTTGQHVQRWTKEDLMELYPEAFMKEPIKGEKDTNNRGKDEKEPVAAPNDNKDKDEKRKDKGKDELK